MKNSILILILIIVGTGSVAARADLFTEKRGIDSRTIQSRTGRQMDNRMEGRITTVAQPAPSRARVSSMEYDYRAAGVSCASRYQPYSNSSISGTRSSASSLGQGQTVQEYRYGRVSEYHESDLYFAGNTTVSEYRGLALSPDDDAMLERPGQQRVRSGANTGAPDPAGGTTDPPIGGPILPLVLLSLAFVCFKLIKR